MDKNFQTQESRLDALENQIKTLDHKLDLKVNELLTDCRNKIHKETMARLDSEYDMVKWVAYLILVVVFIVIVFFR
jgi:hypothetical protein